jgi:4-hydroxybenzoate polyprenyltransferase
MSQSRTPSMAGALVDLTRMIYFGPAVACMFLLGVFLAMPHGPMWWAFARVLFAGLVGFAGGFVLNDWADWRADRAMLAARAHDAQYLEQLRKERLFTGTRPIAAGILSPAAGLAWALGLIAVSAAVCLTFPSPNRWYLLAILAYCTVAEPTYCLIKKKQKLFPIATFFHAPLEGLCPVAAYLAVRPPSITVLGLFASIYFWEVGFNQLYDTIDVENDRLRGITTLSSVLGVRFVAGWAFTFSVLSTAGFVFTWWAAHASTVMIAGVLGAGALMAGADVFLFLRPRKGVARATIGIHLLELVLAVGATSAGVVLHWVGVY